MPDFDRDEIERSNGKPRPKGTLPYLGDLDLDGLRAWLTKAVCPPSGWEVLCFERAGRRKTDPCTLTITNGRERQVFRLDAQQMLLSQPRASLTSVSDGRLRMPHLTTTEVEDFWVALMIIGQVVAEYDERDEARRWVNQLLDAAEPLSGYTLVPDDRHNGLMALKHRGEFQRTHALALARGADNPKRPVRFVDVETDQHWLRSGETLCYLRFVEGVEPLSGSLLRSRFAEIGVEAKLFEDYRPPHPKLTLYRLPDEMVEAVK